MQGYQHHSLHASLAEDVSRVLAVSDTDRSSAYPTGNSVVGICFVWPCISNI